MFVKSHRYLLYVLCQLQQKKSILSVVAKNVYNKIFWFLLKLIQCLSPRNECKQFLVLIKFDVSYIFNIFSVISHSQSVNRFMYPLLAVVTKHRTLCLANLSQNSGFPHFKPKENLRRRASSLTLRTPARVRAFISPGIQGCTLSPHPP